MKKSLSAAAMLMGALMLMVSALVGTTSAAEPNEENCVDAVYERVLVSEAYTEVVEEAGWQRYSWTGGPHEPDDAPAFPSDDWQPNVKGDPHGVGQAGAYFRSHGNSGNGDWFYLELIPAVTIDHPAVYEDRLVSEGYCIPTTTVVVPTTVMPTTDVSPTSVVVPTTVAPATTLPPPEIDEPSVVSNPDFVTTTTEAESRAVTRSAPITQLPVTGLSDYLWVLVLVGFGLMAVGVVLNRRGPRI